MCDFLLGIKAAKRQAEAVPEKGTDPVKVKIFFAEYCLMEIWWSIKKLKWSVHLSDLGSSDQSRFPSWVICYKILTCVDLPEFNK